MRELSLFTGSGGGLLGSRLLGWETICAVEIDPYCQEVLVRRQAEGWLDPFPIWPDVRTFDGHAWRGRVDVVSAGFPCQPFSVAGKRKGSDDERNGWPDTARILGEVRPRYALLENVTGLLRSGYFGTVLGDLARLGFDARWSVFSAAECGAPHKRERIWIACWHPNRIQQDSERVVSGRNGPDTTRTRGAGLADSERVRQLRPQGRERDERRWLGDGGSAVADTDQARLAHVQGGAEGSERARLGASDGAGWWDVEPAVGRVADGVACRVDRLSALGNGQVPAVVARAWSALSVSP